MADRAGSDQAVWRVEGNPLVRGTPGGPLTGTTVAVKDLYAVAGQRIGAGNPTWLAGAPVEESNAWAIDALLAAGADIAGLAQTDEFAYSLSGTNVHYGTPPNPASPGHIPGGSSNGPASAVALGLADVGLGSDTAGSIRIPASYCGLLGFRPTQGVVSTAGLLPLAPSFDTVAWLARDAATLARVGDVLLPPALTRATPLTVGLLADDLLALADPEVAAAVESAGRSLVGPTVRSIPSLCEGNLDAWRAAFRTVQGAQAWRANGPWITAHPGALGPGIADRFAQASRVRPEQEDRAADILRSAAQTLADRIPPGTAILLPAASSTAPALQLSADRKEAVRSGTVALTCLASLAGLPAAVLARLDLEGGPVGLCAIAGPGQDRALLDLAVGQAAATPTR
jgi:Asp-tRNA(Asn)/Glu-tRNA(Gln) amidotransferase A subunit family amidase